MRCVNHPSVTDIDTNVICLVRCQRTEEYQVSWCSITKTCDRITERLLCVGSASRTVDLIDESGAIDAGPYRHLSAMTATPTIRSAKPLLCLTNSLSAR